LLDGKDSKLGISQVEEQAQCGVFVARVCSQGLLPVDNLLVLTGVVRQVDRLLRDELTESSLSSRQYKLELVELIVRWLVIYLHFLRRDLGVILVDHWRYDTSVTALQRLIAVNAGHIWRNGLPLRYVHR